MTPRRRTVLLAVGLLVATAAGAGGYRLTHPPAARQHRPEPATPANLGATPQTGSVLAAAGYKMVRIEPGEFQMGSPETEPGRYPDEAQHRVTITHPFLLGATEVTGALWERAAVMHRPEQLGATPAMSVHTVDWFSAVLFCQRLSELEGLEPAYVIDPPSAGGVTGDEVHLVPGSTGYRLPTEAEWEYAARAGSDQPAGDSRVNAWGLYDMSGDMWEWVWDRPGPYPSRATDPTGPELGLFHVLRGGSWRTGPAARRPAMRGWSPLFVTDDSVGFRIARTVAAGGE